MKITAVIPTKNRPNDLYKAVISIVNQVRPPDELCIVDQSFDNSSKIEVLKALNENSCIVVKYVHDMSILGLVDAKRVATEKSSGDLICFLEDDVVLEKNYLNEIEKGFLINKNMVGCCGIITNPPAYTKLQLNIFKLFHRGIFNDPRVDIYGNFDGLNHLLIPSRMISGGLSAWRSEVFENVKFDVKNHFHMYEDIDFSTRVYEHYNGQLFINPNARLAHNFSPINRDMHGQLQIRKLTECIMYYKKRSKYRWSLAALLWLLFGLLIDATLKSIRFKDYSIIKGYFIGVYKGRKRGVCD
jgi:glucosyl-dolichyl phosphate glucuronosyltransferase